MQSLRVLAVDDSPMIMRLIEVALRGVAELTSCRTATEAVDIGLDHDWDLAIVDISMPHLSGLDLTISQPRTFLHDGP